MFQPFANELAHKNVQMTERGCGIFHGGFCWVCITIISTITSHRKTDFTQMLAVCFSFSTFSQGTADFYFRFQHTSKRFSSEIISACVHWLRCAFIHLAARNWTLPPFFVCLTCCLSVSISGNAMQTRVTCLSSLLKIPVLWPCAYLSCRTNRC